MDIPINYQTMSFNTPLDPNQQHHGLYASTSTTSSSYGSAFNGITYSYNPPLYDGSFNLSQHNPYFTNSQICFKCNNVIYLGVGQFNKCMSCARYCCFVCLKTFCVTQSSLYRCEYCLLDLATCR